MNTPPGRPSHLNPEFQETFCRLIAEDGLSEARAAHFMGVSPECISKWKAKGRVGEEPYLSFLRDVEKARATFARTLHQVVIAAAKGEVGGKKTETVKSVARRDSSGALVRDEQGKTVMDVVEVLQATEVLPQNWQAAMTALERRFPEDFARVDGFEAQDRAKLAEKEGERDTADTQAGSLADVAESLSALSVAEQRELVERLQRNIEGAETLELDEVE